MDHAYCSWSVNVRDNFVSDQQQLAYQPIVYQIIANDPNLEEGAQHLFANICQLVMRSELTGIDTNASFMRNVTREALVIIHSKCKVDSPICIIFSPQANPSHFQREPNARYSKASLNLAIKQGNMFLTVECPVKCLMDTLQSHMRQWGCKPNLDVWPRLWTCLNSQYVYI